MDKNILLSLWHSNSRKVAFGLLLFATATALLTFKKIGSGEWLTCVSLTATLVGGGTLLDKMLDKKGQQVVVTSSSDALAK